MGDRIRYRSRSFTAGGMVAGGGGDGRVGAESHDHADSLVGVRVEGRPTGDDAEGGWSVEDAELLLNSLNGVISVRMVAEAGGEIAEIHLVTTQEVSPKQTVRNVESALLAQLGINVDHRKISVAQTSAGEEERVEALATPTNGSHGSPETRVVFLGHEIENERRHRVRARVSIEWKGERFAGEAEGTDLPRSRLDIVANAVLQGLEAIFRGADDEQNRDMAALALDGVKVMEAFDRRYVLVGVHAIHGREAKVLCGSAPVDDVIERAVVLATLQAADRWVRGRV